MYPPDKEQETECNVCGAPAEGEHHPNCPVLTGEEIFIMDADIINIMTNSIAKASAEYMKQQKEKSIADNASQRFSQMQKDYFEIGDFAQALYDVGFLPKADDVLFFIKHTHKYEPYYMLWLELNRPQKGDETWNMFEIEVWNRIMKRKDDGKQTKDTGDKV